MTSRQELCI